MSSFVLTYKEKGKSQAIELSRQKRKKGEEAVTDLFRDADSVGRSSQVHGALQRREEGCRASPSCVADEPEFSHRAGPTFGADAARGGKVLE